MTVVPDISDIGAVNRQPKNLNFLSGLQFKFVIRKIPTVDFFLQRCNIPSMTLASVTQKTPLQDVPLPGTTLTYGDLDMDIAVDEDMVNYFEIFKWINGAGFPKDTQEYADLKNEMHQLNAEFGGILSDAVLHVLSNESNPIVNIILRDAFPVYMGDIVFDTRLTDIGIRTFNVRFKYAWMDFERVV